MTAIVNLNSEQGHEAHYLFHEDQIIYVVHEDGYDNFLSQKNANGRRNASVLVIDTDEVVKNRYL